DDDAAEHHAAAGVGAESRLPRQPERHREKQQAMTRVRIVPPLRGEALDRLGEDQDERDQCERDRCDPCQCPRFRKQFAHRPGRGLRPGCRCRCYHPPFLNSITGIVFSMILRSSHALRLEMYSRSWATLRLTSSTLVSYCRCTWA